MRRATETLCSVPDDPANPATPTHTVDTSAGRRGRLSQAYLPFWPIFCDNSAWENGDIHRSPSRLNKPLLKTFSQSELITSF